MTESLPRKGTAGEAFQELMNVVERLRDPGGCPWDREQTHQSLRQHLLEETYEALEAIDSEDEDAIAEELGDLLTHIAFHADIARRGGHFDASDVAHRVITKLKRRHPHVFGDSPQITQSEEVVGQWEALKRAESGRKSIVDSLPSSMPALAYAAAVQRRAARAEIPWQGQLTEFNPQPGSDPHELEAWAGEYLMAVTRQVIDAGVDPETALRSVAIRFRDQVRRAEALAGDTPIAELEEDRRQEIWLEAALDRRDLEDQAST